MPEIRHLAVLLDEEEALLAAPRAVTVGGAGLDVPSRRAAPLRLAVPHTVRTPHLGYVTEGATVSSAPTRWRTSSRTPPACRSGSSRRERTVLPPLHLPRTQ